MDLFDENVVPPTVPEVADMEEPLHTALIMQMSEMPRCNIRRKSRTLEDAAELSEAGLRCYEGGDKQGAEQRLRSACAIRPSVPQAHYNLGYFYSLEERWHEAEKALLQAIEYQPDYSRALFALAGVYMALGRLDRAQEKFLTTERLTPDDLDIQLNLGILAVRAGRHEEALDRLDRCIEAEHSTDTARFHRATALQDLGRLDEALVLYRTLVARKHPARLRPSRKRRWSRFWQLLRTSPQNAWSTTDAGTSPWRRSPAWASGSSPARAHRHGRSADRGSTAKLGTDQNAAIHLYTHERACPEARSARGRGVSNNARARQRPWISPSLTFIAVIDGDKA